MGIGELIMCLAFGLSYTVGLVKTIDHFADQDIRGDSWLLVARDGTLSILWPLFWAGVLLYSPAQRLLPPPGEGQ